MHSGITNYLSKADWRVKENSNQHFSLQGLNTHITSKAIANYWMDDIYKEEVSNAHRTGRLHIHDLGTLGPYCVGWDLTDLLIKGFGGVSSKLASKPAKHLRTALMHVVNFMYTLQGEAAGAIAFSHIDTLMAPFIREDGLSYEEVKQVMQEFIFNMNVPTRVGFQTPFTNLTMDLSVPKSFADNPVVVGGVPLKYNYSEVQPEMDVFNRAFSEIMMDGDADGRPFTFPIPTYNITKDFDWDNEDLKPLWEMTAKYGTPYFANYVNSDMSAEDARSMCCRLRIDNRELMYRGGGLFGSAPLTGSIGVVTLNLPRLAYDARKDTETFYRLLDDILAIAKDSLIVKRQVLEDWTDQGLYPYSSVYLEGIKRETGKYWANHFSTIGVIGMDEATRILLDMGIDQVPAKAFAMEVLTYIRETLREWQVETGLMWNLEATPAEGAAHRLAKIDSETMEGVPQHTYYTNSTQLPVGHTDDLFTAIRHQEDLQSAYTGGTVFHSFIGEPIADWQQARLLVKKIAIGSKLPYYTITPTYSICPKHGYLGGNHDVCPECGSRCEVYTRIVGYLRPTSTWNDGKKDEYADRVVYNV